MEPLGLADIADQRAYERERDGFLSEVIALKRVRRVGIGPLVSVVFEKRTTVRFQIQEMARAEKMATDAEIEGELAAYNPLIPGPGEISMTMFVELTTESSLREWLPRLAGIERSLKAVIGEGREALVVPVALDRAHASQLTREETTASVHYVHLQMPAEVLDGFTSRRVVLSCGHASYRHEVELSAATKESIASDWA